MRIKSRFFSMPVLLLFLGACSLSNPTKVEEFMPPTVGEYTRNGDVRNNNNWFITEYSKPSVRINYGFSSYPNVQQAQMNVTSKKFCDAKGSNFEGASEALKEDTLKDKTGKEIGKILICRKAVKDTYSDAVGDYQYTLTLSNDKNYIYLNGMLGSLKNLTDFAEMLPINSQVDFAGLNLQPLIAANSSERISAGELIKLNPPVKLAKEPYIKGKVLIANLRLTGKFTTENPEGTYNFEKDIEKYGLTKDSAAETYEQAETIIQIACSKGERIGDYITKDAEKKKFPAYASNCKISVIDKTILAIIAQKNIVGTTLFQEETFKNSEKEIIAIPSYGEMQSFIKGLGRR